MKRAVRVTGLVSGRVVSGWSGACGHHSNTHHSPFTTVYILEVNPRASRTVPFVRQGIERPLARLAAG